MTICPVPPPLTPCYGVRGHGREGEATMNNQGPLPLYRVAERWPDGAWHEVAHVWTDFGPADAIMIVAGDDAEEVTHGTRGQDYAAQVATTDRGTDDPTLVRVRMFRAIVARAQGEQGGRAGT